MSFKPKDKAREGRENQLYSPTTGARLVAGCVVLNKQKDRVLMIQSSKHKDKWVLPKGGIESDERNDYSLCAERETWEEAGVIGVITRSLGTIDDKRPPKDWNTNKEEYENQEIMDHPPRTEFHFFEMMITESHDNFPESKKRSRKWATFTECMKELHLSKRPELAEAVERSDIKKE